MQTDSIFDDLPSPFGARGISFDADVDGRTGLDAAHLLDAVAIGGNTMVALVESGLGASQAAVVDLWAATGSSAQTPALLLGASAVDTLGADVAMTGQGGGDVAIEAMGMDSLWARDDMPSMSASHDLSISLVLHRIAGFSMTAPSRIALRMGHAN